MRFDFSFSFFLSFSLGVEFGVWMKNLSILSRIVVRHVYIFSYHAEVWEALVTPHSFLTCIPSLLTPTRERRCESGFGFPGLIAGNPDWDVRIRRYEGMSTLEGGVNGVCAGCCRHELVMVSMGLFFMIWIFFSVVGVKRYVVRVDEGGRSNLRG